MRIHVFIDGRKVGDFKREINKDAFITIFKQYFFDEWRTIMIKEFDEVEKMIKEVTEGNKHEDRTIENKEKNV